MGTRKLNNTSVLLQLSIEDKFLFCTFNQLPLTVFSHRYPFYGAGGALAHAFYPTKGVLHFDDAESFTSGVNNGINLYYVSQIVEIIFK